MEEFIKWLEEELRIRDWNPSDLAREAKLGGGTVHRVLDGGRNPGAEFCVAIAKALDKSPEDVFRLAGLLPPKTTISEIASPYEAELLDDFRHLTPVEKKTVSKIMRGLRQSSSVVKEQPAPYTPPLSPQETAELMIEAMSALEKLSIDDKQKVIDFAKFLDAQKIEKARYVFTHLADEQERERILLPVLKNLQDYLLEQAKRVQPAYGSKSHPETQAASGRATPKETQKQSQDHP